MSKVELRQTPSVAFDYPIGGSTEDQFRFALDYAVLAPSSHNSQPWLFAIGPSGLEMFADRTRALPVVDPEDRELIISCGAALQHLRLTLRHFGHATTVTPFPQPDNPDLVAHVTLGDQIVPTGPEHALFRALPRRRTYRSPFATTPVPDGIQAELLDAADDEGAWLQILSEPTDRDAAADLIAEGDRQQAASKHFRRELAAWLHGNRTRSKDGIPGYGFGIGTLQAAALPLTVRTFDWGNRQAAKDHQIAQGSPLLAILGTSTDTPHDWLACGQALGHVLLCAAAAEIEASFLNQAIEIPELRVQLRDTMRCQGYPQLLLRMGYATEDTFEPTPRRPVEDVLL